MKKIFSLIIFALIIITARSQNYVGNPCAFLPARNVTETGYQLLWPAIGTGAGITVLDSNTNTYILNTPSGINPSAVGSATYSYFTVTFSTQLTPGHTYINTAVEDSGCISIPPVKVTTLPATPVAQSVYCTSKGTTTTYERDTSIRINGTDINITSTAGYVNDSAIIVPLTAGSTYTLIVYNGYPDNGTRWLDSIHVSYGDSQTATFTPIGGGYGYSPYSISITLPANATPGIDRIRVQLFYNGAVTACSNYTYGSTVDFSVLISAPARESLKAVHKQKFNTYSGPVIRPVAASREIFR